MDNVLQSLNLKNFSNQTSQNQESSFKNETTYESRKVQFKPASKLKAYNTCAVTKYKGQFLENGENDKENLIEPPKILGISTKTSENKQSLLSGQLK